MKKVKKRQKNPPRTGAKIGEEQALESFLALHPAFEACWKEAQKNFKEYAPHAVYMSFAGQIEDILAENPETDFAPIMRYVEVLMRDGTDDVQGIIAVFFIETLLAASDAQAELFAPILRLLGPESRAYALKWNRFAGAKNKGLEIR